MWNYICLGNGLLVKGVFFWGLYLFEVITNTRSTLYHIPPSPPLAFYTHYHSCIPWTVTRPWIHLGQRSRVMGEMRGQLKCDPVFGRGVMYWYVGAIWVRGRGRCVCLYPRTSYYFPPPFTPPSSHPLPFLLRHTPLLPLTFVTLMACAHHARQTSWPGNTGTHSFVMN